MFVVLEKDRHSFSSYPLAGEKHSTKRRSSGFLRSLVSESKDAILAPFQPKHKKSIDAGGVKEKSTQTKLTDICQFNGTLGGSSATFFTQRYPAYAQRRRRSSRARSDPSTRSLTNLSSISGASPFSQTSSQSFTLPARLEPGLLSPDWHTNSVSLRRSPSSAFSAPPGGPGVARRFNSTSSCPSEDDRLSVWQIFVDPLVEELLKYPWGRDALWLMAFVFFASSLVLLGYVITTVIPTLVLAVLLAILKSLIFNHAETMTHLKQMAHSARTSVFTQEFVHSMKTSSLEVVNRILQMVLPPAVAKA